MRIITSSFWAYFKLRPTDSVEHFELATNLYPVKGNVYRVFAEGIDKLPDHLMYRNWGYHKGLFKKGGLWVTRGLYFAIFSVDVTHAQLVVQLLLPRQLIF